MHQHTAEQQTHRMRDGKERSVMGKMFLMLSSSFPKSLNERKEKKSVWEDSDGGIVLVANVVVVVVVVVIQICIHRGNFKKPWIFFWISDDGKESSVSKKLTA